MSDLTSTGDWADLNQVPGSMLYFAVAQAAHERDHAPIDQETSTLVYSEVYNTHIRLLVALIDPPLYRGEAYDLLRGNAAHAALFRSVDTAVRTAYADLPNELDEWQNLQAVRVAAPVLAALVTDWPARRAGLVPYPVIQP